MPDNLPNSPSTEEAVIGCVLINPELFGTRHVDPQWFFIHRRRFIWEAFQQVVKNGKSIDILTVSTQLEASGHLQEVGGTAYLTGLLNQVPSSLNYDSYVDTLEELHLRRVSIFAASEIVKVAYDLSVPTEKVLVTVGDVSRGVLKLSHRKGILSASEVVQQYDRDTDAQDEVPTGFIDTDRILDGGVLPGDMVLIAGRPGQGKTATLVSILGTLAIKKEKRVAMFSMEMPAKRLLERLLANMTEIDSIDIRKRTMDEEQLFRVDETIAMLEHVAFHIDDTPNHTPTTLRAAALRLQAEHGLDAVIIDYLQLMVSDIQRSENRVREVSQISQSIKALARELNVPVFAACQLSRAVEQRADKEPQLSDLRESGSLEQDSDVVIMLHQIGKVDGRIHGYVPSSIQQVVAKHRNGKTGVAPYLYVKQFSKFYPAARRLP